jgi:hypothetical protein
MKLKSNQPKATAQQLVEDIRRATRRNDYEMFLRLGPQQTGMINQKGG